MNDDVRNIVLGLVASALSAALGWLARTAVWRRRLRRKQAFFGLPPNAECVLVVNRKVAGPESSVSREDVFALLELSALIQECGAHAEVLTHDGARQGFGERAEFCLGGPVSNRRTAAHIAAMLPGIAVSTEAGPGPEQAAFRVGGEHYPMVRGESEHVLVARLAGAGGQRPVFLICGQRSVTNQAGTRYLARHHDRLHRRYGGNSFVLLLKVVNSAAYGPDVVELLADVTVPATTAPAPVAGRESE